MRDPGTVHRDTDTDTTPGMASAGASAGPLRPKIAVIGTGGTFAMHARNAFDFVEYSESGIVHPIDSLLQTLGELAPDVDLLPVPFRALGSVAIQPDDWLALARHIRGAALADPSISGFIVTHGTATLEETAWFLQLTLDIAQPVVVTGAQRPANTAGSDVLTNLRGAIAAAKDPVARNGGVFVAMDGWLHDPRDVTKSASFELNAFESTPFGPLARIEPDGSIAWRRSAVRRKSDPASRWFDGRILQPDHAGHLPRVDIVLSYAGADRHAVDAFVAAGARGIVSAGLVPGRPASGEAAAYRDAAAVGVVVVQASRASRGVVPPQAFLQRDGILAGGDLAPQKLRIVLMLALTRFIDVTQPSDREAPLAFISGEHRRSLQDLLLSF